MRSRAGLWGVQESARLVEKRKQVVVQTSAGAVEKTMSTPASPWTRPRALVLSGRSAMVERESTDHSARPARRRGGTKGKVTHSPTPQQGLAMAAHSPQYPSPGCPSSVGPRRRVLPRILRSRAPIRAPPRPFPPARRGSAFSSRRRRQRSPPQPNQHADLRLCTRTRSRITASILALSDVTSSIE